MPLKSGMNAEKLKRLQTQVRIGGKGTPRRKKKVIHQTAAADDKKLQSSLKKLSVSTIPGIEEVNIIKDDLTVIHFNNPKAQASLSANTFAVTGHGETKKVVEMLPEILPQLGQENVSQLRMLASSMTSNQKEVNDRFASNVLGSIDEDDVPVLVNDFDEIAKKENLAKGKSQKLDSQQSKYCVPSNTKLINIPDTLSHQKEIDSRSNDNTVAISLPESAKYKAEKIAATDGNQSVKQSNGSDRVNSPSKLAKSEKKTANKTKNEKIAVPIQKDKKLKNNSKPPENLNHEFSEILKLKGDVAFEAKAILENLSLNEVKAINVDNYAYLESKVNTLPKDKTIEGICVAPKDNVALQTALNVGSKEFVKAKIDAEKDVEKSKITKMQTPNTFSDVNKESIPVKDFKQLQKSSNNSCVTDIGKTPPMVVETMVSTSHNKENKDNKEHVQQLRNVEKSMDPKSGPLGAVVDRQRTQTEAIPFTPLRNQENIIGDNREILEPAVLSPYIDLFEKEKVGTQGKDEELKSQYKILDMPIQQAQENISLISPRLGNEGEDLEKAKATNSKQPIIPMQKQALRFEETVADTNKIMIDQMKVNLEISEKGSDDQPKSQSLGTLKTAQKSPLKGSTTKESGKQQVKSSVASTITKSPASPKKSDITAKPKVMPIKSQSPSAPSHFGGAVQKTQPALRTSANANKNETASAQRSKVPPSPSAKQHTTAPLKSPVPLHPKKLQPSSPVLNPSNTAPTAPAKVPAVAEAVGQAKPKPDGNIIEEKRSDPQSPGGAEK